MNRAVAISGIIVGFGAGFLWGVAALRFFGNLGIVGLFLLPIAAILWAWKVKASSAFYRYAAVSMLAGSVTLLIMLLNALANFT